MADDEAQNGSVELEYNRVGRGRIGIVGIEDDEPEYGEFSMKISDNKLREWSVTMPYPLEIPLPEAHRRLRDALTILVHGELNPDAAGADA